jgi:hypothetical protein
VSRTNLAGAALVILGLAGAVYSALELTSGVSEIPQHWWSTIATAPMFAGALVLLVAAWSRRTFAR